MKIQTHFYALTPYANLLLIESFLSWDERVTIQHFTDLKSLVFQFYMGKEWGLLHDGSNWELSTPAAEQLANELVKTEISGTLTHCAVVIGKSEIQKWQARNIFKDVTNYEVEFFTDRQAAVTWLASAGYQMSPLDDSETVEE